LGISQQQIFSVAMGIVMHLPQEHLIGEGN